MGLGSTFTSCPILRRPLQFIFLTINIAVIYVLIFQVFYIYYFYLPNDLQGKCYPHSADDMGFCSGTVTCQGHTTSKWGPMT